MSEGQTAPPPLPKWQPSFGKRNSTIIKLLGVGALVLLLLVPLAMITGVLKERLQRRNEAVADITGDVETQMLHRGIYDAAVFRAQVTLAGKFAPPDFGPLKIDLKDVQWKDAFVTIAINDLRGTREAIVLDWGGTKRPMLPGSQVPGYTTGATASLGTDRPIATEVQFSIPLDFNGSEGVFFA